MSSCSHYDTRETKGAPSTENVKIMRNRYLSEPMKVDVEYMQLYTKAHKTSDGLNSFERRAHCHAYALENLTPVIREGELFSGNKTRFVRGAIPYANYATNYILRTLNKEEQETQAKFTEIGTGGGIEKSQKIASEGKHEVFGKKFLVSHEEKVILKEIAEYWSGKCMQDVADRFWKNTFDKAEYIEKGWKAGLYTAPHDPAPEGRYVLDFETALAEGFDNIIKKTKRLIKQTEVTDYESAEKVYFWKAGHRTLEATIKWAHNIQKKPCVWQRQKRMIKEK